MKNYERLMLGIALCIAASQLIKDLTLQPMTSVEIFMSISSAIMMIGAAGYGFWFWLKTVDDIVRPKDSTK